MHVDVVELKRLNFIQPSFLKGICSPLACLKNSNDDGIEMHCFFCGKEVAGFAWEHGLLVPDSDSYLPTLSCLPCWHSQANESNGSSMRQLALDVGQNTVVPLPSAPVQPRMVKVSESTSTFLVDSFDYFQRHLIGSSMEVSMLDEQPVVSDTKPEVLPMELDKGTSVDQLVNIRLHMHTLHTHMRACKRTHSLIMYIIVNTICMYMIIIGILCIAYSLLCTPRFWHCWQQRGG